MTDADMLEMCATIVVRNADIMRLLRDTKGDEARMILDQCDALRQAAVRASQRRPAHLSGHDRGQGVKTMGKTKKPTHMAPRDVRTYTEHLRLRTDNVSTRKAWMMLDGDSVTICNQENGKPAEGSVKLTRKAFERMIAWWQKPQALRKKGTP